MNWHSEDLRGASSWKRYISKLWWQRRKEEPENKHKASGYAGGMTRVSNIPFPAVPGTPAYRMLDKGKPVEGLDSSQMLLEDEMLHRYYAKLEAGKPLAGWSKEDVIQRHATITRCMSEQNLEHGSRDDALDKACEQI